MHWETSVNWKNVIAAELNRDSIYLMSEEGKAKRVRLAVIGSRDFSNKEKLFSILDKKIDKIKFVVSGGAKGADLIARQWCEERGVPCLTFYPKWKSVSGVFDKGAAFKRNHQVIDNSDVVLAMWDGESSGTKHAIELAEQKGKPVKIIKFAANEKHEFDIVDKDSPKATAPAELPLPEEL